MNARMSEIGDTFEKCGWYRDHFTDNRVIVRGARGPFHREFAPDVPVETGRAAAPAGPATKPSDQP
jgi:hypothetical protein